MHYWLLKSEPFVFSWDNLVENEVESWEGVRNYQARNYLRSMRWGDQFFFYHSNEGLCIVGTGEIVEEAYDDPSCTDHPGRWSTVNVKPLMKFKTPISLSDIKAMPELKDMVLVNNTRLSVQPVTEFEWNYILKLGTF